MLAAVILLLAPPDIAKIDQLAQARDVEHLSKLLAPGSGDPFRILRTNGAYEVGSKGWHAVEAKAPSGAEQFVVLTTPLTTEDIGELVFRRDGDRLRYIPESDDLGVHIVRHRFDVRFDVSSKTALLTDRAQFARASNGGAFLFRLSPNYRIASIENADGKPVPYAQAGGTVVLQRPETGEFAYTVRYSGVVNLPQYAGSIGPTEATLTNDYWYPMIAREPAPYEVAVHPPTGWTVVAQGVEEPPSGGDAVRYRMDLPVTYYSLSVGRYRQATKTIGGRTFRAWSPRLTQAQLEAQAELLASVVGFYDRLFGPWPFPGYGALDSPNYGGGALEAYSYATYGGGLPEEDAHEPSHTIFGGVLGNSYLKSFWNESFAAFCEGFYAREVPIGDRQERRQAFTRIATPDPTYEQGACATTGAEDGPLASSLGYGKGSLVLQMLEQLIGTERFVASVKRWRSMNPPGTLTGWEEFEKAVEEVAPDAPIARFFDGWIRASAIPTLSLGSATRTDTGVKLSLQVSPAGFVFPLDVSLIGANGVTSQRTVVVDASSSHVALELSSSTKVARVSVDPWRRVLRKMSSSETVPSLANQLPEMRLQIDPAHKGYLLPLPAVTGKAGRLLIGHPDTMPAMRALCRRVGFVVDGNELTYKGTTIDLRSGGALALVDKPDGTRDAIGLGTVIVSPNTGNARLALFDKYGRFLRGETTPKKSGALTAEVKG